MLYSGSYCVDARTIVDRILENELDPKEFIDDMHRLDVRTLKDAIEKSVPGIVVPIVHVLRGGMYAGEAQELFVYYCKEPLSDSRFDSRNYPTFDDRQAVKRAVSEWALRYVDTLVDMRDVDSTALYKRVAPCDLIKVSVKTPSGTTLVGHQNDDGPSSTVSTKWGSF